MQDVHKSEININGSNQSIFLIHISSKFYFYTLYHKCLILKINSLFPACEILAQVRGNIVAARYKNQTAISFHPELNGDMRLYEWWLNG